MFRRQFSILETTKQGMMGDTRVVLTLSLSKTHDYLASSQESKHSRSTKGPVIEKDVGLY